MFFPSHALAWYVVLSFSFISKYFPTSLIIQECAIYFPNIFEFPIFSVIDFQFNFTVVREDTLHYFYVILNLFYYVLKLLHMV